MTANTHANIISSSFSLGTVFVDGIFISISVYGRYAFDFPIV